MDRYSARISPSACIAEDVDYEDLLERLAAYALRAAFARVADENDWEQEELRRKGLGAVELYHNGRAVWLDPVSFGQCRSEDAGAGTRFDSRNELDPDLVERLDGDLRSRWRACGYSIPSVACDMKILFAQLGEDATECSREARKKLLEELLHPEGSRKKRLVASERLPSETLTKPFRESWACVPMQPFLARCRLEHFRRSSPAGRGRGAAPHLRRRRLGLDAG